MAFVFVESGANFNAYSVFVKALKLLVFSAGLISTLVMVKGALVPLFYEIFFPNLVACWNSFRYFSSSPLYICIIINSVVLLIAATSTFHHDDDDDDNQDPPPPPPPPRWVEAPPPILLGSTTDDDDDQQCSSSTSTLYRGGSVVNIDNSSITQTSSSTSLSPQLQLQLQLQDDDDDDDDEGHDDMIKMAPVDHSLSRDESENETIESTWKTIVEAGGKTKKLTKSESVPPRSCRVEDQHKSSTATATATWKELRKLETFNDVGASTTRRRLGGRRLMRRDPSIGVEEFNQQVEAFIKKFNQDMRLQRQESDQRFLDMINRGL